MESRTFSVWPLISMLIAAEKKLPGENPIWETGNDFQSMLLEHFQPNRALIESLKEILATADSDLESVNQGDSACGIVITSVMDLLPEWLEPGISINLSNQEHQHFPGLRLKNDHLSFFKSQGHPHPVVRIKTRDTQTAIFLTKFELKRDNFELLPIAQKLQTNLNTITGPGYQGLKMPCVDLKQRVDLSWMIGLKAVSSGKQKLIITSALYENHLMICEQGSRSNQDQVVHPGHLQEEPKPDLIIDAPFLIWFDRVGLPLPFFVGHIGYDAWKRPSHL